MADMNVKIVLPYKVFALSQGVNNLSIKTCNGSMGILPHRLDFVTAIVPGILKYKTESSEEVYIAVDEGILIKTGNEVTVSVRNAVGGTNLGKLKEAVEKEFKELEEKEKSVRSTLLKMESGFIRAFEKFHRD